MSDSLTDVVDDLERATVAGESAGEAFASAVAARASTMRATGVRIEVRQGSSGARVQFSSTGRRGYAPATVADKAMKRLVETGQEALSEAVS